MPTLPEGTVVTTPRNEVEYVVTEYGVVDINFDCISTRVKKLISIAHTAVPRRADLCGEKGAVDITPARRGA